MRNQAMEDKVVDLQMHLKMSRDCTAELRAEIAQLTAERDRYKAALEEIMARHTLDAAPLHYIAKKALSQEAK